MTYTYFDNHQYLNIETFRKSGVGVQTPVWFVRKGDALYVWTQANSGKAKRIHNNGRVRGSVGEPVWQRNYYEHIVRDGQSMNRIRRYIRDNLARWLSDRENPAATPPGPEDA